MYSGTNTSNNNDNLPEEFMPFYNYVKTIDSRYNQVVINWYDTNDYIEFHKDCQRKMIKDVPILILTISEDKNRLRNFEIIKYDDNPNENSKFKIPLNNGLLLKMCGNFQSEFKHGIRQDNTLGRRISVSFRSFE